MLRIAFLLILAGAIAAVVAVIAMAVLGAATLLLVGSSGIGEVATGALFVLPIALTIGVAAMPQLVPGLTALAALVGGVLWRAGRRRSWVRRRRSWSAAGALVGSAVFAGLHAGALPYVEELLAGLALPGLLLLVDLALSGALAALMFRTTIGLLDAFAEAGDGGGEEG